MHTSANRIVLSLALATSTIVFGHPPISSMSNGTSSDAESTARAKDESAGGGGIAGFPCPNPGAACCEGTSTVGCEDAACCNLVCSLDPFCCETLWDNICGAEAQQYCTYCGGNKPAPANDNCADAPTITEGGKYFFSTIGATTDGPPIDHCKLFFGDPQVRQDIWFRFVAPETGNLHISVCDSDFDTRLVVYGTCECPVSAVNDEVVCSDDSPGCGNGLQSEVTFLVTQGECYTIRIGGFSTSQGTGAMTIEFVELCKVSCPPNSVIEVELCGVDSNDCKGNSCDGPFNCCHDHAGSGCDDPACSRSICAADPFCCEQNWDVICAALACSDPNCQCDPVSQKIVYLDCGSTVCGELWAVNGAHDLDAFWVTLPSGGLVQWTVEAQTAIEAAITSYGCEKVMATDVTSSCSGIATVAAVVQSGFKYMVTVSPTVFKGLPCGSGNNDYVATLTCDPCFTDINDSGATDVDDLLVVINGWGLCEKPPCASDVNVNGTTDVDDLLYVINHWGEC